MKKLSLLLGLAISAISFAQNNQINLTIKNIKNTKGTIGIALYNNDKNFTKVEYKTAKIKAKKGSVAYQFVGLPKGEYAVAILHDLNSNDKMDFNMIGIPKEPYGFSNNPKIIMKKPSFDDVKFSVNKNDKKNIAIYLNK